MQTLNEQQELFCNEYLKDLNASRAARRAGYSEKTAGQIGWQFINRPEYKAIQERVEELMEQRKADCKVDADYVLSKLKMISEAKIEDFVELVWKKEKGVKKQVIQWKTFDKLSEEQKGAIQSIKQTKAGIEIKLYDKSWSLDMISKHIGLYEKDNEQKKSEAVQVYLPDNQRNDSSAPVVDAPNVEV